MGARDNPISAGSLWRSYFRAIASTAVLFVP